MNNTTISYNNKIRYPKRAPFDPSISYPEFLGSNLADEHNEVYDIIRNTFINAELDKENIGSTNWNPFKELIKPYQTVVIKPNLVLNTNDPNIQNIVTTHGSVIRPIIDYCWLAMEGKGKIIIGDAPQAETNFNIVVERNGILETVNTLINRGINVELKDFISIKVIIDRGIWVDEQPVSQVPADNIVVKLNEKSLFNDTSNKKIRYHGGGYDSSVTIQHHHGSIHEYKVSKDVLQADVVISVPKLKTHKKAGITCCLKNLVGINVDKNFLPHFIIGPVNIGGDEMPKVSTIRLPLVLFTRFIRDFLLDKHWKTTGKFISNILKILYKDNKSENLAAVASKNISGSKIFQGAWSGNSTICKMILDLNRIFMYADDNGILQDHICRNHFFIVDGIIAGDKNGPMEPNSVNAGIVAFGYNALNVDMALLKFIGIDSNNIPLYQIAQEHTIWLSPNGYGKISVNGKEISNIKFEDKFTPPDNWKF